MMDYRHKRLLQNNPAHAEQLAIQEAQKLKPKAKQNADYYKDAMLGYQYHLKASKAHKKY
jgi:hypothetical protein